MGQVAAGHLTAPPIEGPHPRLSHHPREQFATMLAAAPPTRLNARSPVGRATRVPSSTARPATGLRLLPGRGAGSSHIATLCAVARGDAAWLCSCSCLLAWLCWLGRSAPRSPSAIILSGSSCRRRDYRCRPVALRVPRTNNALAMFISGPQPSQTRVANHSSRLLGNFGALQYLLVATLGAAIAAVAMLLR